MSCECDLCQYIREAQERIASLPADHEPFFREMFNRLMHAEIDRDVYRAKFEGKWPSEVVEHQRT